MSAAEDDGQELAAFWAELQPASSCYDGQRTRSGGPRPPTTIADVL